MRPDILVIDSGGVLGDARRLREHKRDELEQLPAPVLKRSAQLLRAAAYQATEAARRMDAIARKIECDASSGSRRRDAGRPPR